MKEHTVRIFLFLLFIVVLLPSCGKFKDSCVNGVGEMKIETRTLSGNFHSVENRTFLTLDISQGPETTVEIQAQQNIIDMLQFDVFENVLTIYSSRCVYDATASLIKLKMPDLQAVNLLGEGNIEVHEFINIDNLLVASSGSGRVSFFSELVGLDKVGVYMSGSGDVEIPFEATNFYAEIRGSGNLTAGGTVRGQAINLVTSGNYEGFGLASDSCIVELAQSGNAEVRVEKYLNVRLGGDGNVTYVGNPTINEVNTGDGEVIDGN